MFTSATTTSPRYDYILCGSGPGAAAWLRSTLRFHPEAKILMLESGKWCKTDILTERNPLRLLLASQHMVAAYNHGVMQGRTLGGGTAVNNYAWVTPSYADLSKALGTKKNMYTEAVVDVFEGMCEALIGPRQPPHLLHQLLTGNLPTNVGLVTNTKMTVEDTNRNKVFIGAPTLNGAGERRSAFRGIIEPLWREHFRNLTIQTNQHVQRVLFHTPEDNNGVPVIMTEAPRVRGVETADGSVFNADTVVVSCGALETPALLMRSGIGPRAHLEDRGVPVLVDNPHVGQHLKDKMLLDDMIITDSTAGDFDKSLLIVNRIFSDGASVQLHRYDKWTFGNTYLAMTRLIRGAFVNIASSGGVSLLTAAAHTSRYVSPSGYSAFCFQTYFKMLGEASVTLADNAEHSANLDAAPLFQEVKEREAELRARVDEIYADIPAMRDAARISYTTTVPSILYGPVAPHFRLVWHFAGTCRVGDVLDLEDFSVLGTEGLHVADMSACRVTSDGGTMGMAYLTGHLAAAHMLRARQTGRRLTASDDRTALQVVQDTLAYVAAHEQSAVESVN